MLSAVPKGINLFVAMQPRMVHASAARWACSSQKTAAHNRAANELWSTAQWVMVFVKVMQHMRACVMDAWKVHFKPMIAAETLATDTLL